MKKKFEVRIILIVSIARYIGHMILCGRGKNIRPTNQNPAIQVDNDLRSKWISENIDDDM